MTIGNSTVSANLVKSPTKTLRPPKDRRLPTQETAIVPDRVHSTLSAQLLLPTRWAMHTVDAGINPFVDAGSYLFAVIGKLQYSAHHFNVHVVHAELVKEIQCFQENVKAYCYNARQYTEHVPIMCYIVCLTLDTMIEHTAWGSNGRWKKYRLAATFYTHTLAQKDLFVILARLTADPATYIEMTEFLYLCLSLGFHGRPYERTMLLSSYAAQEQICHELYKHIRAYRGEVTKFLSPVALPPRSRTVKRQNALFSGYFLGKVLLLTVGAVVGVSYLLHYCYDQVLHALYLA